MAKDKDGKIVPFPLPKKPPAPPKPTCKCASLGINRCPQHGS
jgi:hypothetical protein